MFGRKRGGDSSAKRSRRDGELTTRPEEAPSILPNLSTEELGFYNDNENAKKAAASKKKADKGGSSNAKASAKPSQTRATPAAAPAPRPQPPPPPLPSNGSVASLSEGLDSDRPSDVTTNKGIENGHDPEIIHKILSKIHFPAMHPMFLAENVAPAVLPTHLLTDHEMVTIFIDCLSRSPNKFGLFSCDKRAITPLLSVRPIRSTERPFTIEFNPRDRIHRELKQRILLVSGLPPDRYMLKSENPDVNRLLQEAPEGTTVGDIGLKEGDKIDLVQTIRVKVIGPLADDYRAATGCGQNGGGNGGEGGCTSGCTGMTDRDRDRPRNTIGTLDVMETDKMRDLKPKVQRVLEDQGLSVDGLVFKSHGDDVRDSAAFIECRLDAQGYETSSSRLRPLRDGNGGGGGSGGCSSGCTARPRDQPPPPPPKDDEEFCGMSNCDEKRCHGSCRFPSDRNYR